MYYAQKISNYNFVWYQNVLSFTKILMILKSSSIYTTIILRLLAMQKINSKVN